MPQVSVRHAETVVVTFIDRHPAGHLVVAALPHDDDRQANLDRALAVLTKLLSRLNLKGAYALTVERRRDGPEIQCAIERVENARKVSEAVQADGTGRYPG
jgi:hypothetical protein